ncbi:MAG TPA: LuxR C-terminal-related transcriptional regulator, partial [Chitinophagaceae bacterium]|nr:LuxR C-terminal-related transcriptional regulator [Chitinophagaceae bacterium]
DQVETIIKRFKTSRTIPARYAPVTYLLDYSNRKYLYVDEACFDLMGYTSNYFVESGLDTYKDQWHPDDYKILNEKVYPGNFNFLKTIPLNEYNDYIFSHNHRLRNARGEYITVLQRTSFIAGSTAGKPAGAIGVVFDISHFKNDLNIVHTIEKVIQYEHGTLNKLIEKKIYPVSETVYISSLSKRELEILQLISEGLNSKQIAEKMNISLNTVSNHRKNMLHKTNSKTSAELLNHAVRHGML